MIRIIPAVLWTCFAAFSTLFWFWSTSAFHGLFKVKAQRLFLSAAEGEQKQQEETQNGPQGELTWTGPDRTC